MKKKKKITQQQQSYEELFAYILRNDARIMAFELTLGAILKLTEKQQEQLSKLQEVHFKFVYRQILEDVEKRYPALAARLLDGEDIYSGLV